METGRTIRIVWTALLWLFIIGWLTVLTIDTKNQAEISRTQAEINTTQRKLIEEQNAFNDMVVEMLEEVSRLAHRVLGANSNK